jgi:hypothetical protein
MPTLSNPENYVAGVLSRLHECKSKHGNASVRIGTTGQGLIPYYRIVFTNIDGHSESIFGAYYGDNHNAFKTSESPNNTWSSTAMTFDEVQQLLGKIRGWKRKKK